VSSIAAFSIIQAGVVLDPTRYIPLNPGDTVTITFTNMTPTTTLFPAGSEGEVRVFMNSPYRHLIFPETTSNGEPRVVTEAEFDAIVPSLPSVQVRYYENIRDKKPAVTLKLKPDGGDAWTSIGWKNAWIDHEGKVEVTSIDGNFRVSGYRMASKSKGIVYTTGVIQPQWNARNGELSDPASGMTLNRSTNTYIMKEGEIMGLQCAGTDNTGIRSTSFSFTTSPGSTYQVEYIDNLKHHEWKKLGNPVLATNIEASITMKIDCAMRFYRVVEIAHYFDR